MSYYEHLLIRGSIFYLFYTAVTGTAFYIWPELIPYFRTSHIHAGQVGFLVSMVTGVAFWMMPRPGQIRQEGLERAVFFLLNTGLLLRLIFEPIFYWTQTQNFRISLILSATLQSLAIGVFAYAMSKRVLTKEKLFELADQRRKNHAEDERV